MRAQQISKRHTVVAKVCPKGTLISFSRWIPDVVSWNSYMDIYIIMIIIACFQPWRLWPAPSTNHYTMSFQETSTVYIYIYIYMYILWLLLHVFSRRDYNKRIELPGSCGSSKERWAFTNDTIIDKQLYILWLLLHVFSRAIERGYFGPIFLCYLTCK